MGVLDTLKRQAQKLLDKTDLDEKIISFVSPGKSNSAASQVKKVQQQSQAPRESVYKPASATSQVKQAQSLYSKPSASTAQVEKVEAPTVLKTSSTPRFSTAPSTATTTSKQVYVATPQQRNNQITQQAQQAFKNKLVQSQTANTIQQRVAQQAQQLQNQANQRKQEAIVNPQSEVNKTTTVVPTSQQTWQQPTKQERNIQAAETVLKQIEDEQNNQSWWRKGMRATLGAASPLDIPTNIQKTTLKAQIAANKISPKLNDLLNQAERTLAPVNDWAQNPDYQGFSEAAKDSSAPVKALAWVGDKVTAPIKAGVSTANLIEELDKATNSIEGDGSVQNTLLAAGDAIQGWGDIALFGNAAGTGSLSSAGKYLAGRYTKAAGTGALMNLAGQGIGNLTGQQEGIDFDQVMQAAGRSANNAGAYELTDKGADAILQGVSKTVPIIE